MPERHFLVPAFRFPNRPNNTAMISSTRSFQNLNGIESLIQTQIFLIPVFLQPAGVNFNISNFDYMI